jgi:hypothetical protein
MYEPRHPGDAKDLPLFISRAPTEAAVVAIRDVIVVPTTIVQGDYPSEDEQPAGDPAVEIADSLTLEHLSTGDSGLVMNACTQRGHYFLGVRQFGPRSAFVRQVDPTVYEGERAFGYPKRRMELRCQCSNPGRNRAPTRTYRSSRMVKRSRPRREKTWPPLSPSHRTCSGPRRGR